MFCATYHLSFTVLQNSTQPLVCVHHKVPNLIQYRGIFRVTKSGPYYNAHCTEKNYNFATSRLLATVTYAYGIFTEVM